MMRMQHALRGSLCDNDVYGKGLCDGTVSDGYMCDDHGTNPASSTTHVRTQP